MELDLWLDGRLVARTVERHDRVVTHGQVRRLHQEDMCQARGMRPAQKYDIGRPSARLPLRCAR